MVFIPFIPFLRGSFWLRYKLLTPGPMSSTTFAIWDLTGAGMEHLDKPHSHDFPSLPVLQVLPAHSEQPSCWALQ